MTLLVGFLFVFCLLYVVFKKFKINYLGFDCYYIVHHIFFTLVIPNFLKHHFVLSNLQ